MKATKWKNYPLIITNTNTDAEKIHTSNVKNIFLKIVWHKQAQGPPAKMENRLAQEFPGPNIGFGSLVPPSYQ